MPPRVIFDSSAILNGMTPAPQRGVNHLALHADRSSPSDHLIRITQGIY